MGLFVDCKSQNKGYWDRVGIVGSYFDSIKDYPTLTAQQEQELLYKVKHGNTREAEKARERLVQCNQRFAASVAKHFGGNDIVMDLIEEANIGIMRAIDEYNISNQKVKFATYVVWWMRKYMNEYLINVRRAVIPRNAYKVFTYARKIRDEFYPREMRMPTVEEIQQIMKEKYGLNLSCKEDLYQFFISSIDDTCDLDDNTTRFESNHTFEMATCSNNTADEHDVQDIAYRVEQLMSHLSDRDRYVIRNYFGIGCDALSLEEIGMKLNLTKERIRQIVRDSISELRKYGDIMIEK